MSENRSKPVQRRLPIRRAKQLSLAIAQDDQWRILNASPQEFAAEIEFAAIERSAYSEQMKEAAKEAIRLGEEYDLGVIWNRYRIEVGLFYQAGVVGVGVNGDVDWYDIGVHRMHLFHGLALSDCVELAHRIGVLPSL
jgi:hypothetical protein